MSAGTPSGGLESYWAAESDASVETVRRLVDEQFPSLTSAFISYLGEGWDSRTFDVGQRWILRLPKRADVAARLESEQALLGAVADLLPAPVPRHELVGRPSPHFPFSFSGYRRLHGRNARSLEDASTSDVLTAALGRFLNALHGLPLELGRRCGIGHHGWRAPKLYWARARAAVQMLRPVLGNARAGRTLELLDAGVAEAQATSPGPAGRRLLHNDLSSEHILVDETGQRLTGIIDWSDAEIGDPAVDVAGVFHFLGERGTRRVLACYAHPWDEALLGRARFFAACVGLFQMAHGYAIHRQDDVINGRRAVDLAIASAGG